MLGSNVPTIGGYSTGFEFGDDWGCKCIQIYLTLSRRWDIPALTKEKIFNFKNAWSKSSIKQVVGHIPFLVNLASPNNKIWKKSIHRIIQELSYANLLGVKLLVLHPGSYRNSNKPLGINRIIKALNHIFNKVEENKASIILETMSGQGNTIGSSLEEIKYILQNVKRPECFGVCLDTAHLFQAGYNVFGYKRYESFINYVDKTLGLNKIKVIHLNDSKTELGSRVDRHCSIGEGKMGLQFFHSIIRDKRFKNVPKILEIPERIEKSKESLIFLRNLQKLPYVSEVKKPLIQLSIKELY